MNYCFTAFTAFLTFICHKVDAVNFSKRCVKFRDDFFKKLGEMQ